MSGAPIPSDPNVWVGRTLSHFRVLSEIGRGGMGVVYEAEDELLRRVVALKVLPPQFTSNEMDRQRLLREARTAAALTHANIATIYEVGEAEGTIFIAMELVRGEPLREVMRRGPLPIAQALHFATEIARALARAHEAGTVHRDLKPENVMISGDDVKLLDFGIAKARDDLGGVSELALTVPSPVTARGTLVGTPEYMAPEQLRSEATSARTDVFSFGVLLYEMITAHRPFLRASLLETAAAIWRDAPTPIEEIAPDVPASLAELVNRCLAKEPSARFADAGELVARLRAMTGTASTGGRTAPPLPIRAKRPRWTWPLVALAVAGAAWLVVRSLRAPSGSAPLASASSASSAQRVAAPNAGSGGFTERRLLGGTDMGDTCAFSPDGETVAYFGDDPQAPILRRSIHGGEPQRVPFPPSKSAPRDYRIAGFFADGALGVILDTPENPWTLWRIAADGSSRIVGRLRHAVEWARLSPDGARLLVGRADGMFIDSIADQSSVRIAEVERGSNAAWSPSGDRVAHALLDTAGGSSIEITSVDGLRTQHVMDDPAIRNSVGGVALAWPEANRLLVVFRRAPGSALVEIPLDDLGAPVGARRDLYTWPDAQIGLLAYAKGKIAFLKIRVQREVFAASFAPGSGGLAAPLAPVTADDADDTPVGWLAERRLAYESNREGPLEIDARGLGAGPGGPVETLSRDVTDARVMSTGELLAWKAGPDAGDTCALVRIDASGEHALFTALESDDANVTCYARLRCVRVASRPLCIALEMTHDSSTWSPVDLATGAKGAPIYRAHELARGWDLSPAGDTIAFTLERTPTINYVSLATKALRQVRVTPDFTVQFATYAPDGSRLVLTGMRMDELQYVVALSDLEGHARIVASTSDAWFSAPVVSADGKRLAVGEMRFPQSLGLLEPR